MRCRKRWPPDCKVGKALSAAVWISVGVALDALFNDRWGTVNAFSDI